MESTLPTFKNPYKCQPFVKCILVTALSRRFNIKKNFFNFTNFHLHHIVKVYSVTGNGNRMKIRIFKVQLTDIT